MTSIKGEITDIVLDEMIDYYNSQTLKLYYLEKELIHIKNSSLPMINNNNTLLNNLIIHMTKQQHLFASNISLMENKIKNLTNILNELKQQKPIQHVRRFISVNNNNKIPIGKLYFIKVNFNFYVDLDCDDVFHQQSSFNSEGIFRIKPRFASESFEVKCIFENNTGKEKNNMNETM
jgi:hypothetical protein